MYYFFIRIPPKHRKVKKFIFQKNHLFDSKNIKKNFLKRYKKIIFQENTLLFIIIIFIKIIIIIIKIIINIPVAVPRNEFSEFSAPGLLKGVKLKEKYYYEKFIIFFKV